MTNTSPEMIIERLKLTLTKNNINYNKMIDEMGQVEATEKRRNGQEFTLKEHIKGLVFAMLSNQRPWGPIDDNYDKIGDIFLQYSPDKLQKVDPREIVQKILDIKCGNRSISKQVESLDYNINQFKKIINDFGSMDKFVSSKTGKEIAIMLSDPESPYKIKYLGFALAMEYLRNVGIRAMKPDTHILRICGSDRLAIFPPRVLPEAAADLFNEFAKQIDANPTYIDNLFWIFGAEDYANICSAKPRCNVCELVSFCNYLKKT